MDDDVHMFYYACYVQHFIHSLETLIKLCLDREEYIYIKKCERKIRVSHGNVVGTLKVGLQSPHEFC